MKKTIMEDMTTLMADVLANFLNGSKVFEMEMGILKERLEKSFSETLEEDNNVSYIVEILQRTTMGETIPRELVDILHVEGSCPICLQDSEDEEGGDRVDYSANFVTDKVFRTFDEAVSWADAVAINLGFILVKSSFNRQRDGRPYRYLRCDRGRMSKPRDLENAIRKDTKTKANGCPFYIKISYNFFDDCWFITAKNDHAFMAHPVMIDILRTYPYVIGMDSTYKTNRYGMMFFEIVGVTPTNGM
uniref:Uncharacterized protein n=1 Tax=Chenopodium quinoa TaxID=63459 RepID=A0A803MWX3_CHEQI